MIRFAALVLILAALAAAAAAAAWVWTGRYDAAASARTSDPIVKLVRLATRRSLEARITGLKPPAATAERRVFGFREYDANCVSCHGAPGAERADWAMRMSPPPEDFTTPGQPKDVREVFWATCNGVGLSGMPAFGVRRSDAQIWNIALFLRALPTLTAGDYQDLRRAYGPAPAPSTLAANAACLRSK